MAGFPLLRRPDRLAPRRAGGSGNHQPRNSLSEIAMRLATLAASLVGASLLVSAAAWAQLQPTQPMQPIQPNQPLGQWQGQEGHAPDMAESTQCRDEARRQAVQMYPRQPPPGRPGGANTYGEEDRRYEHEARLYDQCMKSKGYTR